MRLKDEALARLGESLAKCAQDGESLKREVRDIHDLISEYGKQGGDSVGISPSQLAHFEKETCKNLQQRLRKGVFSNQHLTRF